MYDFSDIRKFVDKHETTFNPGLTEKEKARKKIVAFDTPAHVDTRFSADKKFPSTKMKNPVTAAAIEEFLVSNKQFIRQDFHADPEFVYDGSNTEVPYSAELIGDIKDSFDAEIIEFDDKFGNFNWGGQGTLVFSVIVNRSNKQIVIVFRGTYAGNIVKDWAKNLDFKKQKKPVRLNKITDRNVKLHKGFSDYLLGENVEKRPQLDQIIDILKEVYAYKTENLDYSDYELVVTGHSLGGSLAQLCSYMLAGLPEVDFIPKPIKAVTYASPVVGDKEFFKSFQDLEKDGKIMHLRVSNKNDIVPGTPGMGIRKAFVQTGVNIHLRPRKAAEVKYENTKFIFRQLSVKSAFAHKVYDKRGYNKNLYAIDKKSGEYVNTTMREKTNAELYAEHAKLEN
jgi:hypothetical protein